jgi:hypothetical protein
VFNCACGATHRVPSKEVFEMKNSIKLATTVALIALLSGSVCQPVGAFDFAGFLQSLNTGVSDWSDLDARQAELRTQIMMAGNSGQLSTAEATGFNAELAGVARVEAQIKASGRRLGATDSLSFTSSLNSLATRMQAAMDSKYLVNVTSSRDVDALRAQLLEQVSVAKNAGNLTQWESARLKRSLDHNADIQSAFVLSGDGSMTARQLQVVSDDLRSVQVSINQQVKVTESTIPQLSYQRIAVERKIASNLTSGMITQTQAADYKRELARIASMQATFLQYDGALTTNETLAIATELDRLSNRIDFQVIATPAYSVSTGNSSSYSYSSRRTYGGYQQIDARKAQVLARITDGERRGNLSYRQASSLKREYNRIEQTEQSFRISSGTRLSSSQNAQLLASLTQLDSRVSAQLTAHANGSVSYR